jgi:hypothetical protein
MGRGTNINQRLEGLELFETGGFLGRLNKGREIEQGNLGSGGGRINGLYFYDYHILFQRCWTIAFMG